MARLKRQYLDEIRPRLMQSLGLDNIHQAPRIRKIVVSCGVGRAKDDKKALESAIGILERVAGQKANATRARVSVANFRLREGMPIGARVTLRGDRMYEFLDRLINVVTPRIRDFRGLKRTMDGRGGYNMGLSEQTVFPEVDGALLEKQQGMNIAIDVSGGRDDWTLALLEAFQFPFRTEKEGR